MSDKSNSKNAPQEDSAKTTSLATWIARARFVAVVWIGIGLSIGIGVQLLHVIDPALFALIALTVTGLLVYKGPALWNTFWPVETKSEPKKDN